MSAVLTTTCPSPLGPLLLACDEAGLTGLWFQGQRHFALGLPPSARPGGHPHLQAAQAWLQAYFAACPLPPPPPLNPQGTPFQQRVWQALLRIPHGQTVTYGQLAGLLNASAPGPKTSPRAVGHAVGRNPIALVVPCHRVVGAGGRLTGYAAGLDRKRRLLELEGVFKPHL